MYFEGRYNFSFSIFLNYSVPRDNMTLVTHRGSNISAMRRGYNFYRSGDSDISTVETRTLQRRRKKNPL